MERAVQVVPELRSQLEPRIGGSENGQTKQATAGDWPPRDVSGTELPGVMRYPGFLRTYYVREERAMELRYLGQGEFQGVLDHYASQLKAKGYKQEILSATPESERHRFSMTSEVLDFEIRRVGSDGGIEVVLVDLIR